MLRLAPGIAQARGCAQEASVAVRGTLRELYVGNLDVNATPEHLRRAFEMACEVEDVCVPRGRAFGFVIVGRDSNLAHVIAATNGKRVRQTCIEVRENFESTRPVSKATSRSLAVNARLANATTGAEVLALCKEHGPALNLVNLSTALHRLASKPGYFGDPRYRCLVGRIASVQEAEWTSRTVANISWAAVKTGDFPQLRLGLRRAALKVEGYQPQELANTLWAFARGENESELFQKLAPMVREAAPRLKPQELANTAWAYATVREEAGVFKALQEAMMTVRGEEVLLADFTAQQLANTAWAFAKVNCEEAVHESDERGEQGAAGRGGSLDRLVRREVGAVGERAAAGGGLKLLFEEISRCARRLKMRNFSGQELANTAWAFSRVRVKSPSLYRAVAKAAIARDDLNTQDLVNLAVAFARAEHRAPLLFEAIASRVRPERLSSQELANVAWAFAKSSSAAPSSTYYTERGDDSLLFTKIGRAVVSMKLGKSQELANLAWAFATAGAEAPEVFEHLARATLKLDLSQAQPREIAMLAWAFSKARLSAPRLSSALAAAAVPMIFKPREIAMLAWAFATAEQEAPELFDSILLLDLSGFKPQELAMTAWSLVKVQRETPAVMESIARAVLPNLEEASPQALANLVWSFATAEHEDKELFDAIAVALETKSLNSQDVANCAWAFAKAGVEAPSLYDALARRSIEIMHQFDSPQELANLSWAFSTAQIYSPRLFAVIGERAAGRMEYFAPQEIAATAWAFAKAGLASAVLFDALSIATQDTIDDFGPRELSRASWAYYRANIADPDLQNAINRAMKRCQQQAFHSNHRRRKEEEARQYQNQSSDDDYHDHASSQRRQEEGPRGSYHSSSHE